MKRLLVPVRGPSSLSPLASTPLKAHVLWEDTEKAPPAFLSEILDLWLESRLVQSPEQWECFCLDVDHVDRRQQAQMWHQALSAPAPPGTLSLRINLWRAEEEGGVHCLQPRQCQDLAQPPTPFERVGGPFFYLYVPGRTTRHQRELKLSLPESAFGNTPVTVNRYDGLMRTHGCLEAERILNRAWRAASIPGQPRVPTEELQRQLRSTLCEDWLDGRPVPGVRGRPAGSAQHQPV